MQTAQYVDQIHQQLRSAAALGDEHTRQVAESLGGALTSAVQLAIVSAVSDAAAEITAALLDQPGAPVVRAHLSGDPDVLEFDVRSAQATKPVVTAADDGDANARISLRLSESLKAAIDAAAERDGLSVNSWLVRTALAATRSGTTPGARDTPPGSHSRRVDQRLSGWVTG